MNDKIFFKQITTKLNQGIKQIVEQKLFKRGIVKVDFSFFRDGGFINVIILDSELKLNSKFENDLSDLIDYLIYRESTVILLYSTDNQDACLFVEENLNLINPKFLSSRYCLEDSVPLIEFYEAKVSFLILIESLFEKGIYYYGPKPGYNRIGIELMKDECWNCGQEMLSVTGVVFPNKQVKNWKEEDWNYFHSNLNLSDLPNSLVLKIKDKVEYYRENYQSKACLIEQNFSNTMKSKYWSTTCPSCKKMRGNFHLNDKRIDCLHDFSQSIYSGDLRYLGLDCQIDQKTLNKLNSRVESCAEVIQWKIKENVLQHCI